LTKHILIISSELFSLINFRSSLIKYLIDCGHRVTALAPKEKYNNEDSIQKFKSMGVIFKSYSLSRTGLNPFKDYSSYKSICLVISKCKPDIVIAYTAKPVIYAGMAMRLFPKISFFPLITGLGYGFTEGDEVKRKLIRQLMIILYRKGLKNSKSIIFQNPDDEKLFYKLKIIFKNMSSHIVHGSGVDLDLYPFSPLPKKPIFLMLARLLIDKGVREYAEAARIVKAKFPKAIFQLAGRLDSNPSTISSNELNFWINEGFIQYLGEISSVQKSITSCRFYVLPSYREGTPRSVLEAMATGRPVITTDVPGCRETVIHGKNGLLVPPKNSKSLANAMIQLLEETDDKTQSMGRESFILAKEKYAVERVNKDIISILNL
jgi:glycosyltransferase involved in cell wall biosynthesis